VRRVEEDLRAEEGNNAGTLRQFAAQELVRLGHRRELNARLWSRLIRDKSGRGFCLTAYGCLAKDDCFDDLVLVCLYCIEFPELHSLIGAIIVRLERSGGFRGSS
jgi:hypothetical protein